MGTTLKEILRGIGSGGHRKAILNRTLAKPTSQDHRVYVHVLYLDLTNVSQDFACKGLTLDYFRHAAKSLVNSITITISSTTITITIITIIITKRKKGKTKTKKRK